VQDALQRRTNENLRESSQQKEEMNLHTREDDEVYRNSKGREERVKM
jgi:hypothetical protein